MSASTLYHTPPPLNLNRMLDKTLIPLHDTPHQERPTPPKRTKTSLIRPSSPSPETKRAAECETKTPDDIPRANPPTQCPRRRLPPPFLRLETEQTRGNYEAASTEDLREPVSAVQSRCRTGKGGLDGGKSCEARDPENCRAEELRQTGEETDAVEVVVAELGEGRGPDPGLFVGEGLLP